MSQLLAFDNVTFGYRPGVPVLQSLSLGLEPGTTTAILGPNGAGKSTLLHLALGWLKPMSGTVLLDGRPLAACARRQLGQSMSLVPQAERTAFDYTVLEYVLLGRAPHLAPLAMPGEGDQRVALDAIETVGLSHVCNRPVTTLSGGERQLTSLARALAQQPRLLLMDEPTAHLDLAHKARLIRLVRGLVEAGLAVVITTHEPDVAAAVATHMVLMRDGHVRDSGEFRDVFTSENLSALYGMSVNIMRVDGHVMVRWT